MNPFIAHAILFVALYIVVIGGGLAFTRYPVSWFLNWSAFAWVLAIYIFLAALFAWAP